MILRCLQKARGYFGYSNLQLKLDRPRQAVFITLTNIQKRNVLSVQTMRELHASLIQIEEHAKKDLFKILVLRGQGTVFSAGHNLKQLRASQHPEQIFAQSNSTMILLKKCPLITLCVANNIVTAAGFQLALTCDIILASKQAHFGIPGMKNGLFPSTPLVQLQRSSKSECQIRQIMLYGEMITAEDAYKQGLINKVVEEDQFETAIDAYIQKAQKLSGEVLKLGKRVLAKQQSELELETAYCTATDAMSQTVNQLSDFHQGLAAFAEKRQPEFKN